MGSSVVHDLPATGAGLLVTSPVRSAKHAIAGARVSLWSWLVITCLLLGVSGGYRFWRDRQFASVAQESAICPFPLKDIPKVLGSWRSDGKEGQLAPEIARIAGSSDHFIRIYVDENTGDKAALMVLYGLADSVFAHAPDVCYPAAGYRPILTPADHEVSGAGSAEPVRFRASFFTKRVSGIAQYKEVLHTFLHNGAWIPDVSSRWKMFRYHPGMFKIQIEHPFSGVATENNPAESLLAATAEEINSRMSARAGRGASAGASGPMTQRGK